MNKFFDKVSDSDRVWIFATDSTIEGDLENALLSELRAFLSQWKAHGKELKSFVSISEKHFIIIAVDESFEKASGCSIDSMMHYIRSLETNYELNLTDRSKVFYKTDSGEVRFTLFNNVVSDIQKGLINSSTPIYNTALSTGELLKKQWCNKASDSWLKRHLHKTTA